MEKVNCPLCHSQSVPFESYQGRQYFTCPICFGVFLNPIQLPDFQAEKQRYERHKNNVTNQGYQQFVQPIVDAVKQNFSTKSTGLDFGSGNYSASSYLLQKNNYQVQLYDPYFQNNPELLTKTYDFLTCCEVVEHFHQPEKEFQLLHKLLTPGGVLFIMTDIFHASTNFQNWYYKNDFTHVFFYQESTFHWIKSKFHFNEILIKNRLICLKK